MENLAIRGAPGCSLGTVCRIRAGSPRATAVCWICTRSAPSLGSFLGSVDWLIIWLAYCRLTVGDLSLLIHCPNGSTRARPKTGALGSIHLGSIHLGLAWVTDPSPRVICRFPGCASVRSGVRHALGRLRWCPKGQGAGCGPQGGRVGRVIVPLCFLWLRQQAQGRLNEWFWSRMWGCVGCQGSSRAVWSTLGEVGSRCVCLPPYKATRP